MEKENLDPLSSEARSQSGRHLAINEQLHRRLARHTTKSWVQRRKPWVQIAHEIEYIALTGANCSAVKRAGYGRYLPKYKPPLSEQKLARPELPLELGGKFRGEEQIMVHSDEISMRVGESRG